MKIGENDCSIVSSTSGRILYVKKLSGKPFEVETAMS
jgi:hypothetical protein